MAIYQLTETTAYYPLSVEDARIYLKLSGLDRAYEDLVESMLLSAKDYIQRYTSRCIGEHEVVEFWDDWPGNSIFKLKFGLVASVESVEYWDGAEWQEIDTAKYSVDRIGRPARVKMLSAGFSLGEGLNRIRITYTAGSGTGEDLPAMFPTLIRQMLAYWHENGADQDISDMNYINNILNQYVLNK
ncbi:MAG: hypothetical protein LCH81_03655 [Bacteroidetes bacterium]|nr:hypothetical protein [Bacteroidota bacterium]